MPYIKPEHRYDFDKYLVGSPASVHPITPGELNYVFTKIILQYLANQGGISYTNINEVVGVLECCKLELYRRLAAKYEDGKIVENGDVF